MVYAQTERPCVENKGSQGWSQSLGGGGRVDTKQLHSWTGKLALCSDFSISKPYQSLPHTHLLTHHPCQLSPAFSAPHPHLPSLLSHCPHLLLSPFLNLAHQGHVHLLVTSSEYFFVLIFVDFLTALRL